MCAANRSTGGAVPWTEETTGRDCRSIPVIRLVRMIGMKTERTALDVPDRKLAGERFPPELRLRRPSEFEQVFQRGKHASDSVLVIHAMRNDLPYSRLGLSVSRRVGGAVVRNRWKRSIREAWRTQRHDLPVGM